MKTVLVLLLLVLAPAAALADTVSYAGAQLSLPDEGWRVISEDRLLTIVDERGGAFIEVYSFSKLPAAQAAALATLVDGRRDTTSTRIAEVTPHAQHGLRGLRWSGRTRIRDREVALAGVALAGVGGRVALAIAFWRPDLDAARVAEVQAALGSLRARR